MVQTVIVIVVIVSVIIIYNRAKKVNAEREEERKRKEQRERRASKTQPSACKSSAQKTSARTALPHSGKPMQAHSEKQTPASQTKTEPKNKKQIDPFPEHRTDPFAAENRVPSTLTPAELRNWNETFLREEKRGAFRTGESKGRAPFARYLYASDFSHRMLVKLRGYTPRNGLPALVLAEKTKPSVLSCLARNEVHVPPLTEKKTVAYGDYFSLQCVSFPPLPDNDGARDERYASYLTR